MVISSQPAALFSDSAPRARLLSERVKLLMRFADFTGTYAYQCHMLEHAATGLMRDYEVQPAHTSA